MMTKYKPQINEQKVNSLLLADVAGMFIFGAIAATLGNGSVFCFLFGAMLLVNAYIVYKGKLYNVWTD